MKPYARILKTVYEFNLDHDYSPRRHNEIACYVIHQYYHVDGYMFRLGKYGLHFCSGCEGILPDLLFDVDYTKCLKVIGVDLV